MTASRPWARWIARAAALPLGAHIDVGCDEIPHPAHAGLRSAIRIPGEGRGAYRVDFAANDWVRVVDYGSHYRLTRMAQPRRPGRTANRAHQSRGGAALGALVGLLLGGTLGAALAGLAIGAAAESASRARPTRRQQVRRRPDT